MSYHQPQLSLQKKQPMKNTSIQGTDRMLSTQDPARLQALKMRKLELDFSIYNFKACVFILSSTATGKHYSPKDIHPNPFQLPALELDNYKPLFEEAKISGDNPYQMTLKRFKEYLKYKYPIFREMKTSYEANKPKRNVLIRMKEMFDDFKYDASIIYYTGPASKTGGLIIESKDFGEEEMFLADVVNEWKKRSSKQKHLLIINESNYSGKWVRDQANLKVDDVSVFAACREKEKIFSTQIGGVFMHNFVQYLWKSQVENMIPVEAVPVFGGNYLHCKKYTNFYLNFKDWQTFMQVQKSDFLEIVYENGKYIGYIKNAQKQFWGMFVWTTGLFKDCQYIGEFNMGKLHGRGLMIYKGGRVYEGGFSHNAPDGHGEEVYENGDKYIGNYRKGFKFGKGFYIYSNGDIYQGMFAENKPNGLGKLEMKNGSIYEGDFKSGKCNGRGSFKYPNGDIYEGEWINSLKHGKGKYMYGNGDIYEGQFLNGVRHGHGKLVSRNGDFYDGEWAMDTMSGTGNYISKQEKVVGEWVGGNLTKNPTFFKKLGSSKIEAKLT